MDKLRILTYNKIANRPIINIFLGMKSLSNCRSQCTAIRFLEYKDLFGNVFILRPGHTRR